MGGSNLPPLEVALAIKRVNKDFRDEWFADPLNYRDVLNTSRVRKYFQDNPESICGSESEQFNLPKPSFTLRYALETSIYDRVLYQAICDKLITKYDKLLSPRVFSFRLNRKKNSKYLFKQGVDAWRRCLQSTKAELVGNRKVLLVTDIQNYFECIFIDELETSLKRAEVSKSKHFQEYIEILCRLLRRWSPYRDVGIPQNRDASSFLANIYLQSIDEEMIFNGYNYFRYNDDIKIVCDDRFHARKALKSLIVELRHKRLNVNAQKTKILHQDTEGFLQAIPPPNRPIEEIDALFKKRRLRDIRRALPKLREYTIELINTGKTNEKEFRFCVNRLEKVARCQPLNFDFSGIIDPVIDLLREQPWSTDMVVRLLSSVDIDPSQLSKILDFLMSRERNIYEWQGYLLWQLIGMIFKKHGEKSKSLNNLARSILHDNWDPPMKAGAILYLGACGTSNDRLHILRNFRNINSRLVLRSVLIATKQSPGADLNRHLEPYLSNDYKNMYETLKSPDFDGSYFEPPPPLDYRELFDDLPGPYGF